MASYRSIEEYRRKKRRKRLVRNLLLSGAILAALFGVLYLCNAFQGSPLEKWLGKAPAPEESRFPVVIKKEQLVGIYGVGPDLAVLTKSSLLFYDSAGRRLSSRIHGYTNPVSRGNGKRLLTYDRGGHRFRVDTGSGQQGEITMDSPIISAQMSPGGKVAVLMSYRANSPILAVYNENLEMIYSYYASGDFTALAFSSDETHILLSSVLSEGGILAARLYEIDSTSADESKIVSTLVSDILPVAVSYLSDGSWMIAGKDSAVHVDRRTQKQTRYEYEGALQRFAFCGEEALVLVNEDLFSNYSTLTVLTRDGMPQKTIRLSDEVLDVSCQDGQILVLGKQSAYRYSLSLELRDTFHLEQSCRKIILNDGALYVMGEDSIEKFALG